MNADEIESMFSSEQNRVKFVDAVSDTEWGVDVVFLCADNHGAEYAYRTSNPYTDGDWRFGRAHDVAEALEEVASAYADHRQEVDEAEQDVEYDH